MCVKMRVGPGPLAVLALVFWTQCVILDGVEAKKERKRPKEAPPQHTETSNTTLSNSEEVGGIIKVGPQNVWYFLLLLIVNSIGIMIIIIILIVIIIINISMDIIVFIIIICIIIITIIIHFIVNIEILNILVVMVDY